MRRVELLSLEPGTPLSVGRGEAVICIPLYGAHEHFVGCITSVLAHTSPEVPILVCDDAGPDGRSEEYLVRLVEQDGFAHTVNYLRQPRNLGFPGNVNAGFAASAPADVVIVNSDVVVAEGWLERLRAAAYSDSTVATATTLTNSGSLVSIPDRGRPQPLPQEWTVGQAAAVIASSSLQLYPRLPTAIGHCVYIRRSALDLVGVFDLAFSPGYGEEVDFSQRCIQHGLCHVLADDVFVLHHGSVSFAANGKRSTLQDDHEAMIRARYPYYHGAVAEADADVSGPLARSLGAARRALRGVSVMIDARVLSGATTGTQLHVVELIGALDRAGGIELTVLVPDAPSRYALDALAAMRHVRTVTRTEAQALMRGRDRFDLVHRPYQVGNDDDLNLLSRLAERVVVTNQDLIGYHNPGYFRNFDAWTGYRRITRSALSVADHVLFFSDHARRQAIAEDLLEPTRAGVIHIGVDHVLSAAHPEPSPPRGAETIPAGVQTVLCIGTDFRHKNRVFALRILDELQRRHGWDGRLLLVGPTVAEGSSRPEETELLGLNPAVAGATITFPAVSDSEKTWLYGRADLVLYPTVHEGFGLVPFEAADHQLPCLWAAGTSLSEVLPDAAAAIVAWDPAATADAAFALLGDGALREANLTAVRAAAARLTWDAMGRRLVEVYREVCDAPATPGSRLSRTAGGFHGELTEDAMNLVGPGGAIPVDVQRPLLALATRPRVARPMFSTIKLAYKAFVALRGRPAVKRGTTPR